MSLRTPRFLISPASTVFAFLTVLPMVASAGEFRSFDGTGNNLSNPDQGAAETQLRRITGAAYANGQSAPRIGPNPRAISNAVADQGTTSLPNFLGASDWLWQWGQFLDHDIDLTPAGGAESLNIAVPTGDPDFDSMSTGTAVIPFSRSVFDPTTGTTNARQQLNEITSYIDGSNVYGSDATRASNLRNSAPNGQLFTTTADNGEVLLMRNTVGEDNDNGPVPGAANSDFFLAGDVRANEQIGLTAAHTLFLREHNRLTEGLKARLDAGDQALVAKRDSSGLSEGDFLYESARKVVGAQIQKVTYEEFLPLLIGNGADPTAFSYSGSVDSSITNEFSTAAFRLGHTLLSPTLKRVASDGSTGAGGDASLQDSFFQPDQIQQHGVDSLLIGLAHQQAQELDNLLIDDVRNVLFGQPGQGGLDLASLNIQRGRDHGLPGYADAIEQLFAGVTIDDYSDLITEGFLDAGLVDLLAAAYGAGNVDQIDLWIGGISESPAGHGGLLGPTFTAILEEQFIALRDGDRFFYHDDAELEHLELLDPTFDDTLLSDIIRRNLADTNVAAGVLPTNVFIAVPEPTTLTLLSFAMVAAAARRRR